MFNQWCTIESDPGVFTELVKKIGAPKAQVEELYSLEDDVLVSQALPNIYGFIFLFKWTKEQEKRDALLHYDQDLFFARQVVNNACATQAILSILLNSPTPIEGDLKDFYEFTHELNCEDRGLALSNSQAIRVLHNSFKREHPFIFKEDKSRKRKEQDVYHFVSYVPFKGNLYELDGLQPGPILIGKYNGEKDWVELAKQQIQQRIQKYSEKEIRFNLMMVCEDLKIKAERQIQQLTLQLAGIAKKQKELGLPHNEELLGAHPQCAASAEEDKDKLSMRVTEIEMLLEEKTIFVVNEEAKWKERHQENIRRKHNYVPLIIQVLKTLAKKGKMGELIEKASKQAKQEQKS